MILPNAIVDIGNTAIKVAPVKEGKVVGNPSYVALQAISSLAMQEPLFSATSVVIGCSGNPSLAKDLAAQIFARGGEAVIISKDATVPFKSDYAPGQAGVDRLANVAAAIEQEEGNPVILIDAGSAVTIEMIGRGGVFHGGVIMPGLRLQAENLAKGTAALPHLDLTMETLGLDSKFPPTNTEAAIRTGIMNSFMGGIERVVRDYLRIDGMEGAPIIVTGGDGAFVSARLDLSACIRCPRPASYDPALTLKGLLYLAKAQQ